MFESKSFEQAGSIRRPAAAGVQKADRQTQRFVDSFRPGRYSLEGLGLIGHRRAVVECPDSLWRLPW
ncbi:MAG: hypothetical protein J7M14_02015 [Planctomycetes bacterium]|nr:hypothetical protein [Planctomycetota bacterium]